jgi:hypothetical protein
MAACRIDGIGRRIGIEADDVAQLANESRVVGELELFHPVRLQAVRALDVLHETRADVDGFRHHGGGPAGRHGIVNLIDSVEGGDVAYQQPSCHIGNIGRIKHSSGRTYHRRFTWHRAVNRRTSGARRRAMNISS